MKKFFVFSLVLVFLLFTFGSALFAGTEKEGSKEAAKTGEIKILHDNPEWETLWQEFGEASGKDIGIKGVPTVLETQVYKARVKVDLTTDRAPEVFKWWFGYRALELVDAGLLADLSDVWDAVGDNYPAGVREALTLKGITYALPFNSGYWVWFYSKAVYDKYNMELPKTWDEFMKQLAFFKSKGISGIGNTIGKSRWTSFIIPMELLYRIDADFYVRLMNGKAHYTDPEAVQMMKLWKDMLDKGYFAPMDATFAEDLPRMIKEGSLAFAPFGDWYGGILQQQGLKPNVDYASFIPPAITPKGEKSIILEISPLCSGKNAKHPDLAKEWFKWYASEAGAKLLWEKWRFASTKLIPPDVIAKDDPVLAHEFELLEKYPNKMIRFWEATPVEIVEFAVDAFNTMLVNPEQYMDLLNGIEAKAKEVWPKYGVEY